MMMTNLTDLFDVYSLRARVWPGFLTVLPFIATVTIVWKPTGLASLWILFGAAGGSFLLANVVRSRGTSTEKRLIIEWGGWPTTHALRLSTLGQNPVLRDRWRNRLTVVTGIELPSLADEQDDPIGSDYRYEAATRVLINKVRERNDTFPRVQDENTNYGFRRNLYALRPAGLAMLLASVIACGVGAITEGLGWTSVASLLIVVAFATLWLLVVDADWVRQVGDRYAHRLFETLEHPTLSPASEPGHGDV
jgi:hypothetical protein